MRITKSLCLCLGLLGVLNTSALGAKRAFMSEDGAQGSQPITGDTAVTIAPGGTKTIHVFMEDTDAPPDNYNGFQLAFPMIATAVSAGAGQVRYVDNNIPMGGGVGDSVVVTTTRADFLFAGTNQPINYREVLNSRVVVIYNLLEPNFVNPVGIKYCLTFQIQASFGACGTWRLPFRLAPAPGSQFNRPGGALVPAVTFQSLLITVGPPPANNDCVNAIAVTGNSACLAFDTTCATEDGPAHQGTPCDSLTGDLGRIVQDLWYQYTATCPGTLTVSTCPPNDGNNTRIAVYAAGVGCTPTGNSDLSALDDCNDDALGPCGLESQVTVPVVVGETRLIRVGLVPGTVGFDSDTLCFACEAACNPADAPNSAGVIADCGFGGNDPQCTNVSCDAMLGCVYTAKSAAVPCADGTVCTTTDHCSGLLEADACVPGPTLDCQDISPCTADTCDPITGCRHDMLDLADSLPCTTDRQCQGLGLYGTPDGLCVDTDADTIADTCECSGFPPCEADCADLGPGGPNGLRDDICLWWSCNTGTCVSTNVMFADMGGAGGFCPPDGATDANDKFHALNCFSDTNFGSPGEYGCEPLAPVFVYNIDAGGPGLSCCPDGTCDANDAFAALNAFSASPGELCSRCPQDVAVCVGGAKPGIQCGNDAPCPGGACVIPPSLPPHPCPPASAIAPYAPRIAGSAIVSASASQRTARSGDLVQVHLFMENAVAELRGYQMNLGVSGGKTGQLELVDVSIENRADHVFANLAHWDAFNVRSEQMLAGLDGASVPTVAHGYLATFTYRVSNDAAGTFVVDVLGYRETSKNHRTFLFGSNDGMIDLSATRPAPIVVSGRAATVGKR